MENESLKREIRELQYALEVVDGIGRGSEDWMWLLDDRERALLVPPMRKVSVLIRRTERCAEVDPDEALRHASDLVEWLRVCGETVGDGDDHCVGSLYGDAAEQVRDAVSDLRDAMSAEVVR